MNAKELITGNEYWYTAGAEWVKVVFKNERINGYVFTCDGVERELHAHSVEAYIEEIR
ncbi:MAG: hypothetical protein LBV72_14705 [Tannerella sp.]|jgi:hypothetical protein|nr:hypothetical protein [Tannerella sp.]